MDYSLIMTIFTEAQIDQFIVAATITLEECEMLRVAEWEEFPPNPDIVFECAKRGESE